MRREPRADLAGQEWSCYDKVPRSGNQTVGSEFGSDELPDAVSDPGSMVSEVGGFKGPGSVEDHQGS